MRREDLEHPLYGVRSSMTGRGKWWRIASLIKLLLPVYNSIRRAVEIRPYCLSVDEETSASSLQEIMDKTRGVMLALVTAATL